MYEDGLFVGAPLDLAIERMLLVMVADPVTLDPSTPEEIEKSVALENYLRSRAPCIDHG